MNRLILKIAVIILACLLALNLAAGATVDAAPCPPQLCCGGPMDMGHHNGMINFAFPMQGCCEGCNDIFCDLMRDPLQDVNAVNSAPFQGHHVPVILGTLNTTGQSSLLASVAESRHPLLESRVSGQVPLYIENLSLII
jgi:hypothetical protein